MSSSHGSFHFDHIFSNNFKNYDMPSKFERFKILCFPSGFKPAHYVAFGLISGIFISFIISGIAGYFHHVQTLKVIDSIHEEKNETIQNLTQIMNRRVEDLSSDLDDFNSTLNELYTSIKNHTVSKRFVLKEENILDHMRQVGQKLEECKTIGYELLHCKARASNIHKNYTADDIYGRIDSVSVLGDIRSSFAQILATTINGAQTYGLIRDKSELCKKLSEKLREEYGHNWIVFFSTQMWYHLIYFQYYAFIDFGNGDYMVVFRSSLKNN